MRTGDGGRSATAATGRAGRGGVIDNVGSECESPMRPVDHLWAVGYPDDPEVVNNPYRVGLFLGAPSLHPQGILCPARIPCGPSVTFGAPVSSSDTPSLFLAEGGMWREALAALSGEHTTGQDGPTVAMRDSSVPGPGTCSTMQGHPVSLQGAHRDGPRENVRYAYRGTIVGEASHLGPAVPDAGFWCGATPAYVLPLGFDRFLCGRTSYPGREGNA